MVDTPAHGPSLRRCVPLAALGLAGVLFIVLGGRRYLTFAALSENHDFLVALVAGGGMLTAAGFVLGYAALTALSVPGRVVPKQNLVPACVVQLGPSYWSVQLT